MLANWEYTQHHSATENKVVQAFDETELATMEAVQALFAGKKGAKRDDASAANDILTAAEDLAVAAGSARNPALAKDAVAMLDLYIKTSIAAERGNVFAVLLDTLRAEAIAAKALRDVSPSR